MHEVPTYSTCAYSLLVLEDNLRNSCSARHLLSSAKCPLTGLTGDLISADSLLDGGVDVPGVGNFTFVLKENQADESKIVHTCKPNNRLENTTPLVVYQQMYCFRPDPDIVAFGTVNTMKDQVRSRTYRIGYTFTILPGRSALRRLH